MYPDKIKYIRVPGGTAKYIAMDCKNNDKDTCSTDMGRGSCFCDCGGEKQAHACEGCYKLHAYDWLEGMPQMAPEEDIFEVRFKNTRKGFFKNVNNIPLAKGDIVAVEANPGHDIGIVSLTGDMVARQMRRVGFNPQNGEFRKIYRKAKPYDIEKWQEAIGLEHQTMIRSRQIAADMGLNMKIGDVEYQGDKIKAIFYYIADERVDFRELIKVFAEQFHIRIEMKQIGARQEAGRIGGLGSCGRELCCASWISGFVSVTTNAARHQEISLNPQKLAGQCGKLKCCLVYELDSYMDARRDMPRVNQPLQAMDGEYYHIKSDILGRTMSFSTSPHEMVGLVTLPVERVREVIDANRKGQKVDRLEDMSTKVAAAADPGFVNAIGEDSITRFDRPGGGRSQRRGRGGRGSEGAKTSQEQPQGDRQRRDNRPQDGNRRNNRPGEGQQPNRQQGQKQDSNRPGAQQGGNRNHQGRNRGQGGEQQRAQGQGGEQGRNQNSEQNRNQGGNRPQRGQGGEQQRNQGQGGRDGGRSNRGGQNRSQGQDGGKTTPDKE